MAIGIVVRTRVPGPYATQHTQGFGATAKKKAAVKPIAQIKKTGEVVAYADAAVTIVDRTILTATQGSGLPESSLSLQSFRRARNFYVEAKDPTAAVPAAVELLKNGDGMAAAAKAELKADLDALMAQAKARAEAAKTDAAKAAAAAEAARLAQTEAKVDATTAALPGAKKPPWALIGAGAGLLALAGLAYAATRRRPAAP